MRRSAVVLALLGGATALAPLFAVEGHFAYMRQGDVPPFTTCFTCHRGSPAPPPTTPAAQ